MLTLKEVLESYEINVDEKKLNTLEKFAHHLENSGINVTSLEGEELFHKIFADVLIPLKEFPIVEDFIDIGTGGGVPGVIVSVYYDVHGTLVDSTRKKVDLLKRFVDENSLDLEILWARAEELGRTKEHCERYDFVFSKALASLNIALELTSPFTKIGGYLLMYKGKNWKEELDSSWKAMEILGLDLGDVIEYELKSGERRALIIFEKIEPTSKKFPRRYSQIKKKPLG